MKITKIQQYMALAVVVILSLIFVYYEFVLKPLNDDIAFLQSDLKDKQAKLDAAKQMLAKYDEFKKKSAAVLRELEWAQGRMPIQLDRPKFIEGVSALQARTGISLTNFKFGVVAASKDSYTEVPADIKFNANFDQLINFLYQVSVSKNLMIVHDLKLFPFTDVTATTLNSKQTLSAQMILSGIQGKKP
jgi:Tfp pilus assembly protein PilO